MSQDGLTLDSLAIESLFKCISMTCKYKLPILYPLSFVFPSNHIRLENAWVPLLYCLSVSLFFIYYIVYLLVTFLNSLYEVKM